MRLLLKRKKTLIQITIFLIASSSFAQEKNPSVYLDDTGTLTYTPDSIGNTIPDFSYCGYMASESAIPDVPVKVIMGPVAGDNTLRIQNALNYVSGLPQDKDGFRGCVLLEKGIYEIAGSLTISSSGVVLRGSGPGDDGTILVASGSDRATLIRISGKRDFMPHDTVSIISRYYPVNSRTFELQESHSFKPGDRVIINRPSTEKWISDLGTDKIGIYVDYHLTQWAPGDFDINWDRQIISTTPSSITLDVPLTNALDPEYGCGKVIGYAWPGRIKNTGVENLRCISSFEKENPKDENHRWMAITIENTRDSWVRRVETKHFASSAVAVWETAMRITVEDCKSLSPVSETGNFRRYSFQTLGQQVLFQRCYAENGYHDFSAGFTTPGPNAFVQCQSFMPLHFSGAVGGWANGLLFDKVTVDGGDLSYAYRDVDAQGAGWSAANSVFWQCRAARIFLPNPPTAQNWAFGSWAQGYGNGNHEESDSFLKPESLFYAQLNSRNAMKDGDEEKILLYTTSRNTALQPEETIELNKRSAFPDLTIKTWIDLVEEKYPIHSDLRDAKKYEELGFKDPVTNSDKIPYTIENGQVLKGQQLASGRISRTSLWRGSTRPSDLKRPAPNLVRFVPGRTGRGLTDDLDTLVNDLKKYNGIGMQHFPALWYERRRDDHARTQRADADVWTPFYEQPFSRSGQGEAFDRLSKYDLNKWNTWYWLRLKQYNDLADQNGLLLIHEHYLQHNIIEEGAHWTDYPWRTANNINDPGFPEPPHYAGDKRIFMAQQFYDLSNPVLKSLHQQYIRKCLDNTSDNINTIHHLGVEYTGPLHFVEFWLDEIRKWEEETGKEVMVMLPGTKDVQDAILKDKKRSSVVDIIQILQWQYRTDSTLYAPEGGVSLAPRQYARVIDRGESGIEEVYRAVSEYRERYPDKAVVYSRRGTPLSNWASFMAGGSLLNLPHNLDPDFLMQATSTKVKGSVGDTQWIRFKKGACYILFSMNGNVNIDLRKEKDDFILKWIDPKTGEPVSEEETIKAGSKQLLTRPVDGSLVAWLRKK